jgi:hypothetical protein
LALDLKAIPLSASSCIFFFAGSESESKFLMFFIKLEESIFSPGVKSMIAVSTLYSF